ncbi:unnamed protein product, partial [Cercopithifilaria johnstoni]
LNGNDKKLLVGEFHELLSDETITEVFEQLAPRERARFSAINKHFYSLLHPWSDTNRITAHKVGIVIASDRHIFEVHNNTRNTDVNKLASALRSSPFIQKLVISSIDHIRTIPATAFDCLSNLRELTLPCDIFD